jgi:hypothetical protein
MQSAAQHCNDDGVMTMSGSKVKRDPARAGAAAAVLLLALALGGCASTLADMPMVGTPTGAPARPAQPGEYLPVHDLPSDRPDALMAPADQAKLKAELIAARDRQTALLPPKTDPAAPVAAK